MSSIPRSALRDQSGFTLIEILVVILIIGILTAIAVPSFLSQRTKADDACAKAMAKEMFTAVKSLQADSGNFGGVTLASMNAVENSITANTCGNSTAIVVTDPAGGTPSGACTTGTSVSSASTTIGFCVGAQSNTGTWMSITEKAGATYRTCTVPSGQTLPYGGCKGTGGTTGSW